MSSAPKITASELVLSAIFFLQQKNGVSAAEITKFICNKRKCKPGDVRAQVKKALNRAIKNGIFSKKRGLYKIESGFGEKLKPKVGKKKQAANAKRKAKPKNVKNVDLPTVAASKFNEFQPDSCALNDEVFIIDNFPQNTLRPLKYEFEENKKGQFDNKYRLKTSDSRTEDIALEPVDDCTGQNNVEYVDDKFFEVDKDDDFYDDEDDDDEDEDDGVDYFSDDPVKDTFNPEYSETNVPEYSNSESETHNTIENKKRKPSKSYESIHKRKRIESSNELEDENDKKNPRKKYEEKKKPSKMYSEDNKDFDTTDDFDSDEEYTKNRIRGKSEYSFEESEIEYASEEEFKKNENLNKEQSNKVNVNNHGNMPNENQNQTEVNTKEIADDFGKVVSKQINAELKEENLKENQKPLDKNETNEALKSSDPSSNPSESENQKKQSFSSPSESIKQHPALPQDGNARLEARASSRSSKRETTAKLYYSGLKRTSGREKKRSMSESRSSASRNGRTYIS